ncbi:unnamed protein product [Fusarium venenatum]|uniref:Uncharacterized protein n=1 Tax=Fusarium venenatum TaxID=56646 RepID=A0A2L2TA35_9HYPO|nr:uncharacterized protein FVRRES_01315 [Fusarium venenatum]CEI64803.1 unnamed protein product [Fusarium venenatum]
MCRKADCRVPCSLKVGGVMISAMAENGSSGTSINIQMHLSGDWET